MTNAARGEVALTVDGRTRTLCLTLGALAELETAFGLEGLDALGARLRALSSDDLATVLRALLRGGGELDVSACLAEAELNWTEAAKASAECFRRAFGSEGGGWGARLRLAGRLGVGPGGFWGLSVREWRALTDDQAGGSAMDRAAFAELSKHYPDDTHD